jgi:hypothetical protein
MAHAKNPYKYEMTHERRMRILDIADNYQPAFFVLCRFTLLPIPHEAIDAIFQDYQKRQMRGKAICDEMTHVYQNGIVNAAANILKRVKGDTYTKPLFARRPIY